MSDPWTNGGGPAFPAESEAMRYRGMQLRDYFAAHAPHAAWPFLPTQDFDFARLAAIAYGIADEMLEVREK